MEIVLGGGGEAEQHLHGNRAMLGVHELHRARQHGLDLRFDRFHGFRAEEVGLVQNDEIGGEKLILEHLLQRVIVIERGIGGALFRERVEVICEAAGGDGGAVHHRDNAVDRCAGANVRPVERFHQRLRQRQAPTSR